MERVFRGSGCRDGIVAGASSEDLWSFLMGASISPKQRLTSIVAFFYFSLK